MFSVEQEAGFAHIARGDERPLFAHSANPRQAASFGFGAAAAFGLHTVAALAILTVTNMHEPHTPRPFLSSPRLVSVVYIPTVPIEMPKLELTALPAPKPVIAPEPSPERPALVPVRPIESAAIESPVAKPVPAVVEAPRPVLPTPAPPAPTVGVFPEATAAARAPQPTSRVEVAGFDAQVKQATESKLGQATVGAFDGATNAGARQAGSATGSNNVVADSGFGKPAASMPAPTQSSRVIRETGFGASDSRQQPRTAQTAEVKTAGFGDAIAAPAPKTADAAPPPRAVTQVEVLFKPTPVYTEEARKLRIEGDVILQVDFLATGNLRVIRVVRGLGHGLDEAAVKAAEQIRFKPAQANGKAVDSRNTVSIVFRLA